jgi:hypothetical protein
LTFNPDFTGVDFQVKTIRVDDRNIAIQLWDTAGEHIYPLNKGCWQNKELEDQKSGGGGCVLKGTVSRDGGFS